MNLFLLFFLVLLSSLEAKEFCKIENILQESEINCLKGQLLFGSFDFYSQESQHIYEYNSELNIKFVKLYKKQILSYLEKNCDLRRRVKVKEITNLSSVKTISYKTKIIISCFYKNE